MPEGFVTDGEKYYKVSDVTAFLQSYPEYQQVSEIPSEEPKEKPKKPDISIGESVLRGGATGYSMGGTDEFEAALRWIGSQKGLGGKLMQAGTEAVASVVGTPIAGEALGRFYKQEIPRTEKPGLKAEPMTYAGYAEETQKPYQEAFEANPHAFMAADVGAGLTIPIPGSTAAKVGVGAVEGGLRGETAKERAVNAFVGGAAMGVIPPTVQYLAKTKPGRMVAGAGIGALTAGTAAQVLPEFGEESRDIGAWQKFGAGLGFVLGMKPDKAIRLFARIRSMGAEEDVRKSLDTFLESSAKGREIRQLAKNGDKIAQQKLESIYNSFDKVLELEDIVKTYAHTGMKGEYVERAMKADMLDRAVGSISKEMNAAQELPAYRPEGLQARLARKEKQRELIEKGYTPTTEKKTIYLNDVVKATGISLDEVKKLQSQGMTAEQIMMAYAPDKMATAPGGKNMPVSESESFAFQSSVKPDIAGRVTDKALRERFNAKMRDDMDRVYENLHDLVDEAHGLGERILKTDKLSAGRKIKEAAEKVRAQFGYPVEDISPRQKADAFIALDKLKRTIGEQAVKLSNSRESNARYAGDDLWSLYEQRFMPNLEDPSVWGQGASELQKEVNKAWVPYLTARKPKAGEKGFGRFLSYMGAEKSAVPRETRPEPYPEYLETFIQDLGTTKNKLKEKSFTKGIESSTELTKQLAKHYGGDPELVKKAQQIDKLSKEIQADVAETTKALEAKRTKEGLEKEFPGKLSPMAAAKALSILEGVSQDPFIKSLGETTSKTVSQMTGSPGTASAIIYAGQTSKAQKAIDDVADLWGGFITEPEQDEDKITREGELQKEAFELATRTDRFLNKKRKMHKP